jgi:hypothetical protein
MTRHQPEVISTAHRLLQVGAFRGAATILFNAALQRQSAEVRDLKAWSPNGPMPLRASQPHLHASNDHELNSHFTA